MQRQTYSSGAPWEKMAGYSRAVKVGPYIHIAGTVAVDETGAVIAPGSSYEQSKAIFAVFAQALAAFDAQLADVVRTRAFITDLAKSDGFFTAHGEVFGSIRPAATLVEVSGLIGEGTVIEIEADAIIPDAG